MRSHACSMLCLVMMCFAIPLIGQQRFLHETPPDDAVNVQRGIVYSNDGERPLTFDLYQSRNRTNNAPVLVLFNGIGAAWIREHAQYVGWAKLSTSVGMAAITMDSSNADPAKSFDNLVSYLRAHASQLGIDPTRVVVYACSANATRGVGLVTDQKRSYIKGAVIYYGAGEVADFRLDVPLLIVRAGLDAPGLNEEIDRLFARATAVNAPVSLINYNGGHHGFELLDESPLSVAIVDATIAFIRGAVDPANIKASQAMAGEAKAAAALAHSDWAQAIAAYSELLKSRPRDWSLHEKLGYAYDGFGSNQKALAEYQAALDLGSPNKGNISYSAALICIRSGDKNGALSWLENVKDVVPLRQKLRQDPAFVSLHGDARFQAIVESTQ